MIENTIQLKKENIIKLKILNEEGEETGEHLIFDLDDIELPLKYQEIAEQDKKNRMYYKNQLLIIDKKQDHRGKKLLSANEEAKIKALNEFLNKEKDLFNMFLGENGVEKLLAGRKFGITTLDEIDKIIEEQIKPYLDISLEKIQHKITDKYSKKESDILE